MLTIFISYRREDTEGQAGRLFDDLLKRFGEQSVFLDVAAIEPGRDFRKAIDEHVASCSVLLALIGRNWIDARDQAGHRRLDDPLDFMRLEISAALKRDIPVVPVLVQGASMPRADQLPADLADLAFRNAIELTHARWNSDLTVLSKALRQLLGRADGGWWIRTFALQPPIQMWLGVAIVTATILVLGVLYIFRSDHGSPVFLQLQPGEHPFFHYDSIRSMNQTEGHKYCRTKFQQLKDTGHLGGGLDANNVRHIWAHIMNGDCIANIPGG